MALSGGLTLLFTGASIVMRVFSGMLTDRLGKRKIMVGGAVLTAVAVLLIAWYPALGMIAAMQLVFGAGLANLTTASGAAVVDVTPPERLGEGLGYYTLGNSVAMAIGPAIGLAVIGGSNNYRGMYLFALILVLVTTLLCGRVRYQTPGMTTVSSSSGKKFDLKSVIETATIPASIIQFTAIFSFTSVISYIAAYAKEAGFSGIGSFFTVYAMGMIAVRLVIGKIVDKRSEKSVTIFALAVMAIAFVGIVRAESLNSLLLIAVILGLGQGAVMPALQKAAMKHVAAERRGAGNATYQLFADIGTGFGAAVWGIVVEHAGFSAVYYGAAGTCLFGIVLTVFILERRKR